jgi:hypothetical protein
MLEELDVVTPTNPIRGVGRGYYHEWLSELNGHERRWYPRWPVRLRGIADRAQRMAGIEYRALLPRWSATPGMAQLKRFRFVQLISSIWNTKRVAAYLDSVFSMGTPSALTTSRCSTKTAPPTGRSRSRASSGVAIAAT